MMKAEKIKCGGKDSARQRINSGSITATPGWKTRQPRGDWTELPQGSQNTETLDNHNDPTAIRRQTTRCSSQTEVSLVLSSHRRGKGDSKLRSKGVRRKKKP